MELPIKRDLITQPYSKTLCGLSSQRSCFWTELSSSNVHLFSHWCVLMLRYSALISFIQILLFEVSTDFNVQTYLVNLCECLRALTVMITAALCCLWPFWQDNEPLYNLPACWTHTHTHTHTQSHDPEDLQSVCLCSFQVSACSSLAFQRHSYTHTHTHTHTEFPVDLPWLNHSHKLCLPNPYWRLFCPGLHKASPINWSSV